MASLEIRWRSSTKKDLRRIPQPDVSRILAAVAQLRDEPLPHGSEKLAGSDHTYRIRIGDYRVIYTLLRSLGLWRFNASDTEKTFTDEASSPWHTCI
jgi:mRNA interferase RelE/StbE